MSKKAKLAKELARFYHGEQKDKEGRPYFAHLATVVSNMDTDELECIAWLHDILEDTICPEDSIRYLFGELIYVNVVALTRYHFADDETYNQYINRVSKYPLATKVKLSDLLHNMDIFRLDKPTRKDVERCKKYAKAYMKLLDRFAEVYCDD